MWAWKVWIYPVTSPSDTLKLCNPVLFYICAVLDVLFGNHVGQWWWLWDPHNFANSPPVGSDRARFSNVNIAVGIVKKMEILKKNKHQLPSWPHRKVSTSLCPSQHWRKCRGNCEVLWSQTHRASLPSILLENVQFDFNLTKSWNNRQRNSTWRKVPDTPGHAGWLRKNFCHQATKTLNEDTP